MFVCVAYSVHPECSLPWFHILNDTPINFPISRMGAMVVVVPCAVYLKLHIYSFHLILCAWQSVRIWAACPQSPVEWSLMGRGWLPSTNETKMNSIQIHLFNDNDNGNDDVTRFAYIRLLGLMSIKIRDISHGKENDAHRSTGNLIQYCRHQPIWRW